MSNTMKPNRVSNPKDELKEITFTYDDFEYTVPAPKLWPLEAADAEENNKPIGALKIVLGEKQYKEFRSKPRTLGDAEAIMTAMYDAADLESGE